MAYVRLSEEPNPGYPANGGYGEAPTVLRKCDDRFLPTIQPGHSLTANRVACTQSNAFNVAEPFDVITWAVTRALEMLNNTIRELVNARKAVCAGATPPRPLLGDVTLDWLRNRLGVCVDDIQVWTAGTFVNRSVAEVIRRLVRVRNLIGSNGLRYACGSPDCETNDWAFVRARDAAGNCLPGTPQMLIRLCRGFWVPAVRADGRYTNHANQRPKGPASASNIQATASGTTVEQGRNQSGGRSS